jgi:hypothetical protein
MTDDRGRIPRERCRASKVAFRAIGPLLASTLSKASHVSMRLAEKIVKLPPLPRWAQALWCCRFCASRTRLVLWPRPVEQTINWAGDPAKGRAGPGELLLPRARFVAWNGTCRGRSAE